MSRVQSSSICYLNMDTKKRLIHVDTDGLLELLKLSGTDVKSIQNSKDWWHETFHLQKFIKSYCKFCHYIKTNGVTVVDVTFEKMIVGRNDAENDQVMVTSGPVWGLDPGRDYLYVSVDTNENVVSCSNKEYRELAGFIRGQKKREAWLKHNSNHL